MVYNSHLRPVKMRRLTGVHPYCYLVPLRGATGENGEVPNGWGYSFLLTPWAQ